MGISPTRITGKAKKLVENDFIHHVNPVRRDLSKLSKKDKKELQYFP